VRITTVKGAPSTRTTHCSAGFCAWTSFSLSASFWLNRALTVHVASHGRWTTDSTRTSVSFRFGSKYRVMLPWRGCVMRTAPSSASFTTGWKVRTEAPSRAVCRLEHPRQGVPANNATTSARALISIFFVVTEQPNGLAAAARAATGRGVVA